MTFPLVVLLQAVTGDPITAAELNESVDQLTQSTIALAEATANFGALKVMFAAFLVFIFIILTVFFWQLVSTQHKITSIYAASNKIEKFFEEETNRTIGAPQSQILIRRSLNSLAQNIKYNILRIRLENHLDQRDYIHSKVTRIVSYEWGELSSFLTNFEHDKKTLADNLNNDDAQIIINFMLEQIYLDKSLYTVAAMDQSTDLLMNGIKQQVLSVFQ